MKRQTSKILRKGALVGLASVLGICMTSGLIAPFAGQNTARAGIMDYLPSTGDINKAKDIYNKGKKITEATQKAVTELTPEQEYYLGRAVSANILEKYQVLDDAELNGYVNQLGQALAAVSDRPQTFGGYHFVVLDSPEINAFAAPGGLIMVAKGMVNICGSEAELAAVLAHEIGHVQYEHGVASIKSSRWTDLGGLLLKEGINEFGGSELNQLTNLFGESVGDVSKTLMVNGYSRSQETEADKAAVVIMERVGYPPNALVSMLQKMKKAYPASGDVGFAKTHPDPLDRIEDIKALVPKGGPATPPAAQVVRFQRATANL